MAQASQRNYGFESFPRKTLCHPTALGSAAHKIDIPIIEAAKKAEWGVVRALIDKGANINAANEDGDRLIFIAMDCEAWKMVKYLIDRGADINSPNKDGDTVIFAAAYCEAWEIVEYLIDKGADINSPNEDGDRLINIAVENDQFALAVYLAELKQYMAHNDDVATQIAPAAQSDIISKAAASTDQPEQTIQEDRPMKGTKIIQTEQLTDLQTEPASVQPIIDTATAACAEQLPPKQVSSLVAEEAAASSSGDEGLGASVSTPPTPRKSEHKINNMDKLWHELTAGKYNDIEQLLTGIDGGDLISNAQAFLDIKENALKFPEILLFGMALKAGKIEGGDEIIKKSIVKMTEMDVTKTDAGTELLEHYKIAIGEILDLSDKHIIDLQGLLHYAISEIQTVSYGYEGVKLLHLAAKAGHSDIIKLLKIGGKDVVNGLNSKNKLSPLYYAMVFDQNECVNELLSYENIDVFAGFAEYKPIAVVLSNVKKWREFTTKFHAASQNHKVTEDEIIDLSLTITGILEDYPLCDKYSSLQNIKLTLEAVLGNTSGFDFEGMMDW